MKLSKSIFLVSLSVEHGNADTIYDPDMTSMQEAIGKYEFASDQGDIVKAP